MKKRFTDENQILLNNESCLFLIRRLLLFFFELFLEIHLFHLSLDYEYQIRLGKIATADACFSFLNFVEILFEISRKAGKMGIICAD